MLFVIGLNHRSAPLPVRERLAFDPASLPAALSELAALEGLDECLILSTCNRTELYCAANRPDAPEAVKDWLLADSQLRESGQRDQLRNALYRHAHGEAVQHLYGVACGLDSMILGEPQILGQLKDAYRQAQDGGTVGPRLHHLFQNAFAVAKRIRTDTDVGASAMTAASATLALARQIFAGFEKHTALLVGAGEMIELAAGRLAEQGIGRMIIANRSFERAHALSGRVGAFAIGLDEIGRHLAEADIVISSTASPTVVIDQPAVKTALRERRRRPMFLMDMAVPRDIDPRVSELEDAYLYTIDDLREVVDAGRRQRETEATRARAMLAEEAQRFDRELGTLKAVPLIRRLRDAVNEERDAALAAALKQLGNGRSPEQALTHLANALTNKYLHQPSTRLRRAGEEADAELLAAARELFGISD